MAAHRWDGALTSLWTDLDGPDDATDVAWSGPDGLLPSPYPVGDLAMGAVGAAARAACELAAARGVDAGTPTVDGRRVAASFRGDQLMRVDGAASPSFAPLSGFWATRDGWVRTHANYPHHRARLLDALGLPGADTGPDQLAATLRERTAEDVETTVTDAGGIATAVRSEDAWDAHPQGRAVAAAPLIRRSTRDGGPGGPAPIADATAVRPARGLRVLDLTRVLAGPVATRTLALLGADVLRIDPPGTAEIESQHLDTGPGKRSATLDLRTPAGRSTLDDLLAGAHVLVTAYRPGSLGAFGLDPDELAVHRPDLVVATLDAWGDDGPFAARRGFDSIVQAASGIALRTVRDDGRPGALPAQALDHATGYLTAASVLLGLADRFRLGTGTTARLALARTAHRLRAMPAVDTAVDDDPTTALEPALTEIACAAGRLRLPRPAFRLARGPDTWERPPTRWGSDVPAWGPRSG
ncbi:CoA transferase [Pseudonocardia endophytica]|uniref:CoA transferase family III n=1 Tax=Pseudonocardia endophytica TaxID=401976 RepID=A0A4R1I0D0_PSEEN|nr:CoA transferase [Pseudonocardia endophytica]TCK27313.1 CoA transferase family III [Pseudonocardia endophytica]